MEQQVDFLTERRVVPGGPRTEDRGQRTDVCSGRHGGNTNSLEANRTTDKARDIAAVLRFMRSVPDATCDEVEVALNMKHQTCSARFCDLKRCGHIRPTVRRPTRSGCMAQAWAIV
jgi:hypothetical protein